MATSLTLQNDPSSPQGYLKVNGTTAATVTENGLSMPQATIGSLNGILKATSGVVSNATDGTDYLTSATLGSSPTTAKAWVVVSWPDGGTGFTPTLVNDYNVTSVVREGSSGKCMRINFSNNITGYKCVVASSGQNGIHLSNTVSGNTDSNLLNHDDYVVVYFEEAGVVDSGLPWNCVVVFGS